MTYYVHRPTLLLEGEQAKDGGLYIMYHGTSPEVAALIEQGGFKASTQGLLGPGVYVSRDVRKCRKYGSTILEVIVKVGKVCRADKHPDLIPDGYGTDAPWHDKGGYDTAWVPPDCPASVFMGAHYREGLVEEDCVWDAGRVSVLGRAEDKGDDAMRFIVWCFEENEWRMSAHSQKMMGCWVPFSGARSMFIESHHRLYVQKRGRASVLVVCEESRKLFHRHTGVRYEVHFDRMVQRNVETGWERRIMRVDCLQYLQGILRAWLVRYGRSVAWNQACLLLQKSYRGHRSRKIHR